jgi:DNA-binding transcriptional ArsR family regulator
MDPAFVVIADPTRRRILDALRVAERSVTELVEALAVSQPAVSKHLRVLREAGFVSARIAAQQRIYALDLEPLRAVDEWLAPYRRLWTTHLDALEQYLDDTYPNDGGANDGDANDNRFSGSRPHHHPEEIKEPS